MARSRSQSELFNRGPGSRHIPLNGHGLGSLVDIDLGDIRDLFNFATNCADTLAAGHVGNFESFAFHEKTRLRVGRSSIG
jgi:hypothetical protein